MSVVTIPAKSRFKPETAEYILHSLPQAVMDTQKQAQTQLAAQGIPTPKLESWGFSNLPVALKKIETENFTAPQISIQNISYARGIPQWAQSYFHDIDSTEPSLRMLTMAMLSDIYVVDIAPNLILDEPISIDWILSQSSCAHVIIRVQKNASITVKELQEGTKGWRLGRMIVVVEDNARIEHVRVMNDSSQSVSTQSIDIITGRDAVYSGFVLNKGSSFSRTEIHGQIQGENSEITLNGLQLQSGQQVADTTILIEHQKPHGRSNQFYKTILANEAIGIFQGKIHVHQIAQKTDGYQMSNGILLSQGAQMNTKPQLEIYADDVKCSHGTTTGQLDETPLFYLCSRGIPEIDARRLLLESAMGDVIDKIANEDLQSLVSDYAQEWLMNVKP